MVHGEIFTAVDIGSSRIKTVIGTFTEDKKLRIEGIGVSPSSGVRKGNILDMDEFKNNVDFSLTEAEKMVGEQIASLHLGVSGTGIEVFTNTGIVSIPHQEVSEDDVNRALDMSQNGVDMLNKTVLKVVPEIFSLDIEKGIKNPIGMAAKRLEVRSHIFTINSNTINNIRKGIDGVGVEIIDVYPNAFAAAEAVLSKRQKELGVVCVDIGASTTGITVYEEGVLVFSSMIPIGGEHVTSDVALGLRISIDLAEKLKLEYGDVILAKDEKGKDEEIDLSKISRTETGTVSKKYLSEIVRARYSEMLYFINSELKKIGKDGMLPEGAVITGGGAKMRNLPELAKEILRLPVSIGTPEDLESITGASIGDPSYASVVGILLLSQKYGNHRSGFRLHFSAGSFWNSLKNLFSKLVP